MGSNDCGKGCSWCDGDCQNFGVPIPKGKDEWKTPEPLPPMTIYGGTLMGDDGTVISHFPDQTLNEIKRGEGSSEKNYSPH